MKAQLSAPSSRLSRPKARPKFCERDAIAFRFFLRSLEAALLSGEQWHLLERELKPDLTAAAASDEPASLGSGAVCEAATPPAVAEAQEKQAAAAIAASHAVHAKPIDKSTDEIRIRRLGDLGDVIDPQPGPAGSQPDDPDAALVDSDLTTSGPAADEPPPEPNAPTDRQAPPRPAPPEDGKKGGKP